MSGEVSVVIPTYNAAGFIDRAVRSALNQTHPVSEVIVVDDASSDETTSVVRGLAEEDSRVKLIAGAENRGPAAARNRGFAEASGDWIAVLDADDAFLPQRIEAMIQVSDGADIVADNFLPYDRHSDQIGPAGPDPTDGAVTVDLADFADAPRDKRDFGMLKPMFRRAFLEQHGLRYPEERRHGEDFLLVVEALARGAVFRLLRRPGYLYTTRSSGWSRTAIDYDGLASAITAFAGRQDLELSPQVRAKLIDRAAYTRDLHVRHALASAMRDRRPLGIALLAARHGLVRKIIAGSLVRRLRGSKR
jgi:succinoglycan biosynthesis protein ExoO